MSDPVEELIREIAAKHSIAVGRDDPILILQTINQRLMVDTLKAQEEILSRFKSEIEHTCTIWGEDTKTKAERIINTSLAASREAMESAIEDGSRQSLDNLKSGIAGILSRTQRIMSETKTAAWISVLASLTAFFSAGISVWFNA